MSNVLHLSVNFYFVNYFSFNKLCLSQINESTVFEVPHDILLSIFKYLYHVTVLLTEPQEVRLNSSWIFAVFYQQTIFCLFVVFVL